MRLLRQREVDKPVVFITYRLFDCMLDRFYHLIINGVLIMPKHNYSLLFQLTFRFIKYFFLGLIGLCIALVLSMGIGALNMVMQLLPFVFDWIFRIGSILLCLIMTTIMIESLR